MVNLRLFLRLNRFVKPSQWKDLDKPKEQIEPQTTLKFDVVKIDRKTINKKLLRFIEGLQMRRKNKNLRVIIL